MSIEIQHIDKHFGSFHALRDVNPVSYTHLTLPTTPYV